MIKKIFQDVLPPNKKSIRHIPLPSERRAPINNVKKNSTKITYPSRSLLGKLMKYLLILLVILIAIISVLGLFSLFSSSKLTIYPKTLGVDVNVVLESLKSDQSSPLFHVIATASTTKSLSATATKEKDFDERAKGVITIFNDYSSASQRLIKNTRFETPDGRIYRIDSSVVVPGQTDVNGVKVAGSVDAVVYADVSGAEYNIKAVEMTANLSVPGFAGSPRFDYFYAKLKTDIVGGFSGTRKYLDDNESKPPKEKLKEAIFDELKTKITVGVPENYIIVPGGFFVEYQDNPETVSGDKVNINMLGVAYAVIVDKLLLSEAVADLALEDYDGAELYIKNLDDLDISVSNKSLQPWAEDTLIIDVAGKAVFQWSVDTKDLINAVSGKPKSQIKNILSSYDEIERAEVVLKPFWLSNFPTDPEKINVEVVLDSN